MAGVMFILIMACGNVANLMLARGVGRTNELALRSALGATRGRVLRQLLTESVVLAAVGGAAGLGLAALTLRAVPSLVPAGSLPLSVVLRLDWRVVTFSIVIASLAALASTLGPAWQVSRTSLVEAIGMGTRMSSASGSKRSKPSATKQFAELDGVPVLLPSSDSTFRRALDEWFQSHDIRPEIIAELDDLALASVLSEKMLGVLATPDVIEKELRQRYALQLVGRVKDIRQRFYAISVERQVKNPAVAAICQVARKHIFA